MVLANLYAFGQYEQQRMLQPFSALTISESVDAVMKPGDREKIIIRVDREDGLQYVTTQVEGDRLVVGIEDGGFWSKKRKKMKVSVEVYYRELDEIRVNSSARLKSLARLEAESLHLEVGSSGSLILDAAVQTKLKIKVSSSGTLELVSHEDVESVDIQVSSAGKARIEVCSETVDIKISSGSKLSLTGKASSQRVRASSGSSYESEGFVSGEATISVSSGARTRVHVVNSLDATASSGGSVKYRGDPGDVKVESTMGGSVRPI